MTEGEPLPTELRVFPDYGADPVWQPDGMADLEALPVSARLRTDLRAWAREWEDLMGTQQNRYTVIDDRAYDAWQRQGARLARALQGELGDDVVVSYEA